MIFKSLKTIKKDGMYNNLYEISIPLFINKYNLKLRQWETLSTWPKDMQKINLCYLVHSEKDLK